VVRNGYQPEREVLTGVGPVAVRLPKTRDRAGEGRCFRSALLPPYLKKTKRLDAVIPWLYLKGVSTNDFDEALKALFGKGVKGLSASTISRLKQGWEAEYAEWRTRDWHGHEFVYLWADGIYTNVRAEERRCVLVLIGCDVHGRKHFLAIEEGFRESKESWKALLLGLKDRGLNAAKLAVGDGALGFWAALDEVYPTTRHQRCWVHKTVNVLDKLPKRLHGDAKAALHEIWQADSRAAAEKAFDRFVATYQDKYPKAVDCLVKDRDELLAFYDFPAAHWQHIRTTNPIESTFATIRLRTKKTRNCVSAKSGLSLMHQLAMSAQKRWRRLRGFRQLADVVAGVKFIDGMDERKISSRKAA
jgi:transposase-like protein